MKTTKILMAAFAVLALASCNKQDLPYDLAGTEHSVVINISKVAGTSTTLSTDMNDGNYQVLLTIPAQQGDYSMLKEAQVMGVYTDGNKNKKAAIVASGITTFPATVKIDIKDACSKLGISEIAIGDRLEFTPCHTLKSGTQVNGWSELTGFNNQAFTGWEMENGSAFSFRVAYTAFAPFHKEKFQGDAVPFTWSDGSSDYCKVTQISDMPNAAIMSAAGVTESDLVGLRVEGDIWAGGDVFTLWINTQDYTLIMPDHIIAPNFTYGAYGTYDMYATKCEGEVDTLNNELWFYFYSVWGPYSFGSDIITIYFPK